MKETGGRRERERERERERGGGMGEEGRGEEVMLTVAKGVTTA